MLLAEQPTEQHVREMLVHEQIPVSREALSYLGGYDKWVFALEDSWVVRFPRSRDVVDRMVIERTILKALDGSCSLVTPRVVGRGRQVEFDVCSRVPGEQFDQAWWDLLPADRRQAAGEQLGNVVFELGTKISPEAAFRLGLGRATWPPRMDQVMLGLRSSPVTAELIGPANLVLRVVDKIRGDVATAQFLHGDLAGHNLSWDRSTGRILGIFDFGDAALDSPYFDFQYASSFGREFTDAMLWTWEARAHRKIDHRAVRILHAASAIAHAAHAAIRGEATLPHRLAWARAAISDAGV